MTGLVLGWIGVAAALFILITQPWRSPAARAPLPIGFAALFAAWALWDGATSYQDMIAQGAWTAATLLIPYVGLKIIVYAVLAYALARTALAARTQDAGTQNTPRRYLLPASLAVVTLVALGADIQTTFDAARIRTARAQTLTLAQIDAVVQRIDAGIALNAEIQAFLENPLCPPALLRRYADDAPSFRVYVARNPKTPADLLLKLSQDAEYEVRYSATYNENLPASELPRMAKDSNAIVRETAAWKKNLPDEAFTPLLDDAEPRVRAAAALQPRITDAALLRLTEDPDPGVRSNAVRIAVQRGLKE